MVGSAVRPLGVLLAAVTVVAQPAVVPSPAVAAEFPRVPARAPSPT
jgi:hypothetical protein